MPPSGYEFIYAVVRRIPRGRIATYGQIAALAGIEGHARRVGYALHALPQESNVPWQRVVNARGAISLPPSSDGAELQRILLEMEGVKFSPDGRISLERFRWKKFAPRMGVRSKLETANGGQVETRNSKRGSG